MSPFKSCCCGIPSRSIFVKRTRAFINRSSHHSRNPSHLETDRTLTKQNTTLAKNTSPREVVLPLYCSSSAQEAIHHTTHRSRVLHHNGGPNLYKSCVSCVVHQASLEIVARLRACFSREKSSCAPKCLNLKGFVGTRNSTITEDKSL